MKILNFNSIGGASGDMILGTLINLGVNPEELQNILATLNIGSFSITAVQINEHSLSGTKATVTIGQEAKPIRHLGPICEMISSSSLPEDVKEMSIKVFTNLAEAEAKVHGTTTDHIHFHEVGAVDSIIDIIGSCLAISMLNIDAVIVDPLPVGCGFVDCEHGRLPVPVPATVELLKNHPIEKTDEPFELVTPTGAALLTTWQKEMPASTNQLVIKNTGTGFGQRHLNKRINMLRAILMESAGTKETDTLTDSCVVLETNLDDTTPEIIGALAEKLLQVDGVLDVYTTPVQMKKQRPGTLLTVLCSTKNNEKIKDLIFLESTTFGIREYVTTRTMLDRKIKTVSTPYGDIKVKIGILNGKEITKSPEFEDCRKCAEQNNIPVQTVYRATILINDES